MTRHLIVAAGLIAIPVLAFTQSPEPPITDARLTVHTLVREDIFAGFLQSDLQRMARAEKNLARLLESRPADRENVLAWQGSIALTRAVLASEAKQQVEFRQHYQRARELFEEAMRLGPDSVGVFAITGGSQVSLADRLPAEERARSWELAYSAYQRLWKLQGAIIEKLPLHHKGEVLSGLAQSAQRTGRNEEASAEVDRILKLLPGTPYAKNAQQWKDDPSSRARVKVACQTCHAPGTLVARLAEVSK
jgi:tetratricopeptide (TPR) repeat protein